MKHITVIFSAVLILFGMATVSLNTVAAQAEPLKTATNFSLKNASGDTVSLADFAGKPVVVHFWATWCPYCKKLQPGLEKLRLANANNDLVMLAISFNEDEGADPAGTLTARNIGIPTLLNGDKVAADYGVQGTPTTVFISRDGKIVWVSNSSNPDDPKLEQAVNLLVE